jgi:tetratricopeptide (TPR) repeat protein
VLRAGPFSDERVVRLANRRFVPFYFDLDTRGAAGDADARKFVVAARKDLKGSAVATPPVLFMTADGDVVGEVDNYASTEAILKKMHAVLDKCPDYAKPAKDEREDDPDAAFDLGLYERAAELFAKAGNAYGVGRAARMLAKWDDMEKAFATVKDAALADDVTVERAYRLWVDRSFEELRDALKDVPATSNRYTEARYYLGLAYFHLDAKVDALKVWKETIKACSQDPWIYRADWAYCDVKDGGKGSYSSADPGSSCLGRIGYMGRRNPDLKR